MKHLPNSKHHLVIFYVHIKPHRRITILARWSATGPAKHGISPGPQWCYTDTETPSRSCTELGSTNPQEGGWTSASSAKSWVMNLMKNSRQVLVWIMPPMPCRGSEFSSACWLARNCFLIHCISSSGHIWHWDYETIGILEIPSDVAWN